MRFTYMFKKTIHCNNHYNKNLKFNARNLRLNSISKAEKLLWKNVLSKRQTGKRFLRQRPISCYIVDFFSTELKLIIEIDGSSHLYRGFEDKIRQSNLESLGYTVIRFTEREVLNDLVGIKSRIDYSISCLHIISTPQTNSDTRQSHLTLTTHSAASDKPVEK